MSLAVATLRLTGLGELRRALADLGPELSERILVSALSAAAAEVETEIRIRTPVAARAHRRGVAPGALLRSVQTRVHWRSADEVRVTVGPRISYAHLVEYGHGIVPRGPAQGFRRSTARRPRGGGEPRSRVAARPFVGPAWAAIKDRVTDLFHRALVRGIEEVRALRRLASRQQGGSR